MDLANQSSGKSLLASRYVEAATAIVLLLLAAISTYSNTLAASAVLVLLLVAALVSSAITYRRYEDVVTPFVFSVSLGIGLFVARAATARDLSRELPIHLGHAATVGILPAAWGITLGYLVTVVRDDTEIERDTLRRIASIAVAGTILGVGGYLYAGHHQPVIYLD